MLKHQASLEFLISYGWIILIMTIIVGILFSFGFFNPSSYVTNTPTITGFADVIVTAAAENGSFFYVTITNQYGQTVRINNVTMLFDNINSTQTSCSNITMSAGQYDNCYIKGKFSGNSISAIVTIFYTIISSNINTSTFGTIRVLRAIS